MFEYVRGTKWQPTWYAESKKKMAEMQAHPDFAKSTENASTAFSRTPESAAASPSTSIPSMDSISRMSAENRRETQSKANREDVRSLYESVFREENENNSTAIFNRRSYVNMLKKSLGKQMGCSVVYDQDEQAEKELAALEEEAGKALEDLGRARARFAFVRGQVPKARSQSLASSSNTSSTSSRARRVSKIDEAHEASTQKLVTG